MSIIFVDISVQYFYPLVVHFETNRFIIRIKNIEGNIKTFIPGQTI